MSIPTLGVIIGLIVLVGSPGCGSAPTAETPVEPPEAMQTVTIEEAQKTLTDRLMKLPGVVGTGIGLCGEAPCIKVYLVEKTEVLTKKIPATFQGHRVTVEVSGEVTARPPRFD